jgi:Phage integrase family/Arm DNA-binding domain
MIPKNFGLLFYLKKQHGDKKVNRPIYLRITVDGVLKEMSVKRSWDPARWNPKIGRAIVSKLPAGRQSASKQTLPLTPDDEGQALNAYLDTLQANVHEARHQLLMGGKSIRIPLLPMAEQILVKYADHPQCKAKDKVLPILSNQKMNAYLKEIADCCGITKRLTFHIARHTFATTITLSNGVPIETVSKMLGHRNLKTTQHYAKILDRKVSQDMQALKEKLLAKPIGHVKEEGRR